MKVLIIRDNIINFQGGIKKHCDDLFKLFNGDKNIQIQNFINLPCVYLPIIRKHITNFSILKKHIIESKCDIVHIHGFMSIFVLQAILISYKLNKKIIYSPHFHPFIYLNRPFLAKVFFNLLLRPLLNKVDVIITINKEDTLFFSKYHNNIYKIPHWLNKTERVSSNTKIKNMILFVGRNDTNKGIDHLYALPKNKYQIHCVTGGILRRNDFIQHKNLSTDELNNLYKQASVVVVPSRYEAFSLVALEALSNHTPIVISERVRIADYLTGNNAYKIFKYGDYKDFENAIDTMLQQSNQNFDVSILQPFSPQNIKNEYKKIYLNDK